MIWTERFSGQDYQRGQYDHRDAYERDRTRVIHCAAFRRLQRKTQILGTDQGDFHRTRLTHSLEVASIGVSLVRGLRFNDRVQNLHYLLPNDDLMHVICLLHDIGHPPFGHGGETALNYMMRNHGGFEGNGQTLRLLTNLDQTYGEFGLDLTRRSLLGILKYPVPRSKVCAPVHDMEASATRRMRAWLPPKAYLETEQSIVTWLLSPFSSEDRDRFQSLATAPKDFKHGQSLYYDLDCSIMDIADDIAYGVHDLEDAIHLQLIHRDQFETSMLQRLLSQTTLTYPTQWVDHLFDPSMAQRKQAIGQIVNYFMTEVVLAKTHEEFENPLLRYNAVLSSPARALLDYLTQSIYDHVIDSQEARTFEYGGQMVILRLFEAMMMNPESLLDRVHRLRYAEANDEAAAWRVVCDYIASMTDDYAYRMHERLFGMNTRTIFERL